MQKTLMAAAIVGAAVGGYYFAGATEFHRMYAHLEQTDTPETNPIQLPPQQIAVRGHYRSGNLESPSNYDVTYDRGVVFIWQPAHSR